MLMRIVCVLMGVNSSVRIPIEIDGRLRMRVRELKRRREGVPVSVVASVIAFGFMRVYVCVGRAAARGRAARTRVGEGERRAGRVVAVAGVKWGRGARREVQRGVEAQGGW
jgi:hypothetical protein